MIGYQNSLNKGNVALMICTVSLFLFQGPAYSRSIQQEDVLRKNAVADELSCIEVNSHARDGKLWNEVCYSSQSARARVLSREEAVDRELDEITRIYDVPRKEPVKPVKAYKREQRHYAAENDSNVSQGLPFAKSLLKTRFDMLAGYRHDQLQWNIAGDSNGNNPNILSELTWKNLQIYQVKAKGNISLNNFVIDGDASIGTIFDGKNQDSDYLGNNRTLEFSRSNNKAGDGDVLDLSGGIGYRLLAFDNNGTDSWMGVDRFWVTPLAGYSYHEQNLTLTDGTQTIPATGSFAGLNSTYETQWKGPWIGFEVEGVKDRYTGRLRLQYNWAEYYAQADWNLRNDYQHPKSYEHIAEGHGLLLAFNGEYQLNNQWSLNLNGDLDTWYAEDGTDRTFLSSGGTGETRLNEVSWDSYAILLGLTYRFVK